MTTDVYRMSHDKETDTVSIDDIGLITRFEADPDGATCIAHADERRFGGVVEHRRLMFVELP